jgi:hypothetical protein
MEAITDHQPPTVLVELVLELLDVGGDLGLQRRGQHLPSTVAHDLIKKRPTGRLVGRLDVVDYLEHERTFPNQRANAGPDQIPVATRSSSGRCAPSPSPADDHPQVLIIAPGRIPTAARRQRILDDRVKQRCEEAEKRCAWWS